jgi:hypothetical protein
VYTVPYVAKEMPPFKTELASDTPTSSSEGERLGRWRNRQEALLNKEESPFFILKLSLQFTFNPKCFIWYKTDLKLY